MPKELNRRSFIKYAAAMAIVPGGATLCGGSKAWGKSSGLLVNDVHSQLNPTRVKQILQADSVQSIINAIILARQKKSFLSICGGRHAGGGQQFGNNALLLDTRKLNKILHFDQERGLIEVEAGINWIDLLKQLDDLQVASKNPWNIKQKQTGADNLSIGGTVSANAHGQGLTYKPFISDVESFSIVSDNGELKKCSRSENEELFRLVCGGYGLFGALHSVTLRLVPRIKLERVVEIVELAKLNARVEDCIKNGYLYGDYKINIDSSSEDFLRNGFFCSYRPADPNSQISQLEFNTSEWLKFVEGAHVDMHSTYEKFLQFTKASAGQVNWADAWQMGPYIPDYHRQIDVLMKTNVDATEVLSEVYVPRQKLAEFMEEVRRDFLANHVNLIFSVIRFISQDDESFLPWAKQSYACMILNLHTLHTTHGIDETASTLRRLIDIAIKYGGSYYLTYTKFPRKDQLQACYPQFDEFLKLKLKYDPDEVFQSDWYRHYNKLF